MNANIKLIISILSITALVLSGCALSEYVTGGQNKTYTLLTEKEEVLTDLEKVDQEIAKEEKGPEDNVSQEIEDILKEIEGEEAKPEETKPEIKVPEKAEPVAEEGFIKISVKENQTVKLKPKATDLDDDVLKFTFSEPLDANGEWKTDFGDAGNYIVTITASDGKTTTEKKVLLTVERVNVPPKIEPIADIIVDEGSTLTLSPKVSDLNGDRVTIKMSDPVGDDGKWEIGYQKAGDYTVTIKASDGEAETVKPVKITVKKKNIAPVIESIADITINEGDTVTLAPKVSDVNGDKIKVTISEPVGDDGKWETDYTEHGVYTVTIKASDGSATSTQQVKLTVNDINKPPVIVDIENIGK